MVSQLFMGVRLSAPSAISIPSKSMANAILWLVGLFQSRRLQRKGFHPYSGSEEIILLKSKGEVKPPDQRSTSAHHLSGEVVSIESRPGPAREAGRLAFRAR